MVATLAEDTWYNYGIGFPFAGSRREVFNSDVYDNWVNPIVALTREGSGRRGRRCMAFRHRRTLRSRLTVLSYSNALERELSAASALAENRRVSAICPNSFPHSSATIGFEGSTTGFDRSWMEL